MTWNSLLAVADQEPAILRPFLAPLDTEDACPAGDPLSEKTNISNSYNKGAKMRYIYIVYRGFNHSVCVLWAEFYAYYCIPTFSTKYTHPHTHKNEMTLTIGHGSSRTCRPPSFLRSSGYRGWVLNWWPRKIMTTTRMKKYTQKSVTMVLCSLQNPSLCLN